MMDEETVEALIRKVILKYINPKDSFIFLFGSRALGNALPSSDYDIGLYQGEQIPIKTIAKIRDELEDYPIPLEIDLVDFAVATDEFKELALRGIRMWNTPKKNLELI